MTFHLRRVDSSTHVSPAIGGSVLKAVVLDKVSSARDVIERAQQEAERILQEAHRQAEGLAEERLRARELALADREAELEELMWRRAASFTDAITQDWERAMAEVETNASTLLARALTRLTPELPAESRLHACVNELLMRSGAPDHGVLLVAPEDEPQVSALAGLPWQVRSNSELPAGTVRLVCAQGCWECDVHSALERLLEALGSHPSQVDEPASLVTPF